MSVYSQRSMPPYACPPPPRRRSSPPYHTLSNTSTESQDYDDEYQSQYMDNPRQQVHDNSSTSPSRVVLNVKLAKGRTALFQINAGDDINTMSRVFCLQNNMYVIVCHCMTLVTFH